MELECNLVGISIGTPPSSTSHLDRSPQLQLGPRINDDDDDLIVHANSLLFIAK